MLFFIKINPFYLLKYFESLVVFAINMFILVLKFVILPNRLDWNLGMDLIFLQNFFIVKMFVQCIFSMTCFLYIS